MKFIILFSISLVLLSCSEEYTPIVPDTTVPKIAVMLDLELGDRLDPALQPRVCMSTQVNSLFSFFPEAGGDASIRRFDSRSGQLLSQFRITNVMSYDTNYCCQLSKDRSMLLVDAENGVFEVDLLKERPIGPYSGIRSAFSSPGGGRFVSINTDKTISDRLRGSGILYTYSYQAPFNWLGLNSKPILGITEDYSSVLIAERQDFQAQFFVTAWDLKEDKQIFRTLIPESRNIHNAHTSSDLSITSIAMDPDGWSEGAPMRLQFYTSATGSLIQEFSTNQAVIEDGEYDIAPDNTDFVFQNCNKTQQNKLPGIYNLHNGKLQYELSVADPGSIPDFISLSYDYTGKYIYGVYLKNGTNTYYVCVWKL